MPRNANQTSFKPGPLHSFWGGGGYDYWCREARKTVGAKKGEIVHHIDGNHKNNSPDNLKIMTQSKHVGLHNKLRKGEKNYGCLRYKVLNDVLELTNEGLSSRAIAIKLGISKTTVLRCRRMKGDENVTETRSYRPTRQL